MTRYRILESAKTHQCVVEKQSSWWPCWRVLRAPSGKAMKFPGQSSARNWIVNQSGRVARVIAEYSVYD